MQKRDFETDQKRFRDFEILPKFSKTHILQGTIDATPTLKCPKWNWEMFFLYFVHDKSVC